LTRTSFLLARGRSLDVVTEARALATYSNLRDDLDRLSRGLYVAELLDRLIAESEENQPLFRLLVETLERIDLAPEPDAAVRFFEMQALDLLGYRPQLEACVVCGRPLEPTENFYSSVGGGVICPGCAAAEAVAERLSVNALKYLRLLQRAPYAEVERVRLPAALWAEVERHVRGSVRATIEREVRAAQFMDAVRRTSAALLERSERPPGV
jgi:DNA repair protein RecO (recombination protein O)